MTDDRPVEHQVSDARQRGINQGERYATRAIAEATIQVFIEASESYHDHELRAILDEAQQRIKQL